MIATHGFSILLAHCLAYFSILLAHCLAYFSILLAHCLVHYQVSASTVDVGNGSPASIRVTLPAGSREWRSLHPFFVAVPKSQLLSLPCHCFFDQATFNFSNYLNVTFNYAYSI